MLGTDFYIKHRLSSMINSDRNQNAEFQTRNLPLGKDPIWKKIIWEGNEEKILMHTGNPFALFSKVFCQKQLRYLSTNVKTSLNMPILLFYV